jgi:hypothetical protein
VNLSSVSATQHPGVEEAWCLVTRGERADILTGDTYDSTANRERELAPYLADAQRLASTTAPTAVLYGQNWSIRGPLTLLSAAQAALGGVLVPAPAPSR